MCHLIEKTHLVDVVRGHLEEQKRAASCFFNSYSPTTFYMLFLFLLSTFEIVELSVCVWLVTLTPSSTRVQNQRSTRKAMQKWTKRKALIASHTSCGDKFIMLDTCSVFAAKSFFFFLAFTIIKDTEHHNLIKRLKQQLNKNKKQK